MVGKYKLQITNIIQELFFSFFHVKDMNEPANFVDGDLNGCLSFESDHWETPQYLPDIVGNHLNYKTICMSARHHAGVHYNLHNLYGLVETITTYK